MLAVLREVAANMRSGVIQKADFKIVYVAPMKVGSPAAAAAAVLAQTQYFCLCLALLGSVRLSPKHAYVLPPSPLAAPRRRWPPR